MSTTPKTTFDLSRADRELADGEHREPFAVNLGPAKKPEDAEGEGENEGDVVVVFIDPDTLLWTESAQISPDAPVNMMRTLLTEDDFRKVINQRLTQRQMKALMKAFAEHYGWVDLGNRDG